MNKADQRDFDSHYEYWDKIKGVNGGEMSNCCGAFDDLRWDYRTNDGGHYITIKDGCCLCIEYCPFCGKKLEKNEEAVWTLRELDRIRRQ